MKFFTLLGDGMSDLPLEELKGHTPLELAEKPQMDRLCAMGEQGLVANVPEGMSPGSDVANMSAMGVDPRPYYTGRSPLEAVSMGIELKDSDIAFRTNLVTISDEENLADCTMLDYSSGEISSGEAAELIAFLNEKLDWGPRKLYAGKSYRHCMIWADGPDNVELTPPHDIFNKNIGSYLPSGDGADVLLSLMETSRALLKTHPVNLKRVAAGLNPAGIIWPWGLGTRPSFPTLEALYGLKGSVISAVDLVQGIGVMQGMEVIQVEGATGTLNSNFEGKAKAAIDAFERGRDYVFLHLEAPDECGHQGDVQGKIKAIEIIDEKILAPIWQNLEFRRLNEGEDYKIYVLPDHPTPLALRTHTSDPVPYILFDSRKAQLKQENTATSYTEKNAAAAASIVYEGHRLVERYFRE